jgi:hypothetical protein
MKKCLVCGASHVSTSPCCPACDAEPSRLAGKLRFVRETLRMAMIEFGKVESAHV